MQQLPLLKAKLIPIGGNEDKGREDREAKGYHYSLDFIEEGILSRIVAEAVDNPRVEVIPTASGVPKEVADNYVHAFGQLGCDYVAPMLIDNRKEALTPEYLERLRKADVVMFTGGNQLRLSTVFGGTEFLDILRERITHDKNFVVAGTSAGAMAMSSTMIYQGNSASSLNKGEVKRTGGLSFLPNTIIDSHFVQRGRIGRLMQAVADNPSSIGIGLGEDTGVVIKHGYQMEVIGSGQIVIVDGREIGYTNIADVSEGEPLSIERLIMHVLARGNHFNLRTRAFIEGEMLQEKEPVE